ETSNAPATPRPASRHATKCRLMRDPPWRGATLGYEIFPEVCEAWLLRLRAVETNRMAWQFRVLMESRTRCRSGLKVAARGSTSDRRERRAHAAPPCEHQRPAYQRGRAQVLLAARSSSGRSSRLVGPRAVKTASLGGRAVDPGVRWAGALAGPAEERAAAACTLLPDARDER